MKLRCALQSEKNAERIHLLDERAAKLYRRDQLQEEMRNSVLHRFREETKCRCVSQYPPV